MSNKRINTDAQMVGVFWDRSARGLCATRWMHRLRGGTALQIGRATVNDLEAIAALHAHFWGEISDVSAMAQTLARLEGTPDHILLAARVDGSCVGTATGVICHGLYGGFDSYLVIEDVVVDPDHRRAGIAARPYSVTRAIWEGAR